VGSKYDHLNREELIRLLETRDRRARFGLVWEADEIERDQALNSDFVALELVPELSCGPAPWHNLIVEGDNFDALRHLRMAFAGQVKCIYIDPPYNTGNRDFVYNDRFVDKEDSWRHSKWCEFMFQRLMLAREFLREDGLVFVSIDDNEVAPLRLLMDRIFGAANWLSTLIWKKSYGGGAKTKHVLGLHEYVFCFAQSKSALPDFWLPPDPGAEKRYYKFRDEYVQTRGPYRIKPLEATKSMDARPNLVFAIPTPDGGEAWPKRQWWWSKDRVMKTLAGGGLHFTKTADGWSISYKQYLIDESGEQRGVKPFSIIDGIYTQQGTDDLRAVFDGEVVIQFPKPVALMERLLQIGCGPNDLVLDFFAGSGTTAHAVHKLNAEDGGKRRVILVSSTEATAEAPDKNLCRDVCATRVRRIIEGYTPAGGEPVPGLGGDFAYLRTQRVPAGRLLEVDHAQVWTALQLMHRDTLKPFANDKFCWAGDEDEAVMYVPRFRPEDAPLLRQQVKRSAVVALYSWQPRAVAQHLRATHVTHLAIPETLARRFGLGQGGKA
jgi:adenine-specific DNA-methyltransferase